MWIYSTNAIKTVRGFDEKFSGWGKEERDLQNRLEKYHKTHYVESIIIDSALRVSHMSHTDDMRGIKQDLLANNNKVLNDNSLRSIINVNNSNWGKLKILKHHKTENVAIIKTPDSNPGTIVIMGNGPSLKGVDFNKLRNVDTFGMNGAYRYYYRNNWWPTYFACFDYTVTDNHAKEYKKMIENPNIPIKQYFLIRYISNSPKLKYLKFSNEKVGSFSLDFDTFGYGGNTGVNCCQVASILGYKKIILIGVDCSYVEKVPGSATKGGRLEMIKTPETNPNYFFDDYQQKGDRYNLPKPGVFHIPAWRLFAIHAKKQGIDVVNCSPISKVDCFRKSTLDKELSI